MEIRIVDSYRNLEKDYWEELNKFYAQNVFHCQIQENVLDRIYIRNYETAYGAKWFHILAYQEKKIVGFMQIFRDPRVVERWYFCDVHVEEQSKHTGIATKMYEVSIDLVKEFDKAEYIDASISKSNAKSIGLHKKFGFADTLEKKEFAEFSFEEDETMYRLWLYQEYPVVNTEIHYQILLPLWKEYLKENNFDISTASEEVKKNQEDAAVSQDMTFHIIWCGEQAVGFRYEYGTEKIIFITKHE